MLSDQDLITKEKYSSRDREAYRSTYRWILPKLVSSISIFVIVSELPIQVIVRDRLNDCSKYFKADSTILED